MPSKRAQLHNAAVSASDINGTLDRSDLAHHDRYRGTSYCASRPLAATFVGQCNFTVQLRLQHLRIEARASIEQQLSQPNRASTSK